MPGFDDAATSFDSAAVSFDAAGAGGTGTALAETAVATGHALNATTLSSGAVNAECAFATGNALRPTTTGSPAAGSLAVTGWGGVSVGIEVAFVVDEFIIGTSLIGITPLGPTPEWTDITTFVQGFTSKRGRQRSLERSATGGLSIDLNNTDGRFDPTNLAGPYVAGGVTQVVPGAPVRVRTEYGGITYDIWRGYVDSWPGSWAKGPHAPSFASLEASGVFGWPAGADIPAGPSQGAGETSGRRVDRILDKINWPTFARDVDTGVALMQDTTLEGGVLDQLQSVAESEGGVLYETGDGSFAFRDRQAPYTRPGSVSSRGTFGDHPGELPYYDLSLDYSTDLVKNDVTLQREGADMEAYTSDSVSQRKFGVKTFSLTGLQNVDDPSLVPVAIQILNEFAEPELRFDSLTVRPEHSPTVLWPLILSLELRDRISILRRPAAGNTISQDVFLESISHSVKVDGPYELKFDLSTARAFTASPFIIGVSLLGGTDVLVP